MTIKQQGGIFGTNPTFNNVEVKTLNVDGAVVINSDATTAITVTQNDNTDVNGLMGIRINNSTGTTYAAFGNAGASGVAITAGDAGGTGNTSLALKTADSGAEKTRLNISSDGSFVFTPDGTTHDMTLDANGNLLVGQSSSVSPGVANTTTGISVSGEYDAIYASRADDRPLVLNRNSDGVIADIRRSGVTIGSIGVVNSDNLFVAGNASHVGIGMGSTSIYGASQLGQIDDGAVDLGASNARWDDVYAVNGTIQTSDRNEKQDIEALSDAEQRVAVAAKGLLRKFRWISSVEEKGDDARIHFGIIAQDLQAAFESEGLDAGRYGMFISTTWIDEETGEERSRMGIRYSELLAFIIAAV